MLSKSLFLGLVVLASACGAEAPAVLSPQGDLVRYEANASAVANCTAVGEVHTDAASSNDTLGTDYKEEQQAGQLGANVVYVDEKAHPHFADGTAYKCPP